MKVKTANAKISIISYIFGGLSFIPLVGIIFGIFAILLGLSIRKKLPIFLGASGILLTIIIYGSLFYFGMVANFGPYHELKKQLTKQILTQTRGQILIYKEKNKKLPIGLEDLERPSPDNLFSTSDPWLHKIEYTIKKNGTFELRSYGPDGIPNNSDDIVSTE